MFFASQADKNHIFCIDLTAEAIEYIRKQRDWVLTNPEAIECSFEMSPKRARYCEEADYGDIVDKTPVQGDRHLNYFGYSLDEDHPKEDYWEFDYDMPKKLYAIITKNFVFFEFILGDGRKKDSGHGINFEDLFRL